MFRPKYKPLRLFYSATFVQLSSLFCFLSDLMGENLKWQLLKI